MGSPATAHQWLVKVASMYSDSSRDVRKSLRFDTTALSGIEVVESSKGSVSCLFPVTRRVCTTEGHLHGGCIGNTLHPLTVAESPCRSCSDLSMDVSGLAIFESIQCSTCDTQVPSLMLLARQPWPQYQATWECQLRLLWNTLTTQKRIRASKYMPRYIPLNSLRLLKNNNNGVNQRGRGTMT